MKNIIFIFAAALLLKYILCETDFLSKFHQHTYKVKDIRVQLISYDKNYVNVLELKSFKFNRTTTAINGTWNLKINVEDKLEVVVQGYKFLSNEYKMIALRFQVNVNKCFDKNIVGLQGIKKCGNVTNFIFSKEITYHICNFVIDETQLPPLIPNGMYKADHQMIYLNKEVAMFHAFFEIYTPIYPNN